MRHAVGRITALLVLSSLLGACSHNLDLSRSRTQMRVGTNAARQNLWREALFRFNKAVQIDPKNAAALNNLAVAYEGNGEFEKARQLYVEALRLDKGNPYIQKNYSRCVEFTSKNKKRDTKEAAAPSKPADKASSAPAPPSVTGADNPAPPPPVTAPGAVPPGVPSGPTPAPPPPNPTPPPQTSQPPAPGGAR